MTTKSSTELTRGVPAHGFVVQIRDGCETVASFVGEIEEEFWCFGEGDADTRVFVDDGACAPRVDGDDARVGGDFGGELLGCCLETVAIASVERGQTTAATNGAHGSTRKFGGYVKRVFGHAGFEARVAASDEHTRDGFVLAHAGFEFVVDLVGFSFARGGSSSGRHGCRWSGSAGEEIRAGVDENFCRFVAMVALLAARVTARAGPGSRGVFDIDGYVSASGEVRHAHLAPRRQRFARFRVGYRTSSSAEFGAVDTRFEGTFVRRDNRQTEHVTSVRVPRGGCNRGLQRTENGRRAKQPQRFSVMTGCSD